MRKKFYVDSIPNSYSVFGYLKEHTDWFETKENCKPRRKYPSILELNIEGFDVNKMAESITDGYEKFGAYGWLTKDEVLDAYQGVSLVYNPYHQEKLDPHRSTLGTSKNASDQFFYGKTENHDYPKNSYFDSYSFNTKTPFMENGYLGEFGKTFKRTQIRSRCSTIHPECMDQSKPPLKRYHRDEEIFENLRVNIPVTTYHTYFFEIQGTPMKHLEVGKAYTFDSNIPHSVFTTEHVPVTRTNLVLGFSPWFDYLPEEKAWVQNEFWGKHPFDMLMDGDIIPGVSLNE